MLHLVEQDIFINFGEVSLYVHTDCPAKIKSRVVVDRKDYFCQTDLTDKEKISN